MSEPRVRALIAEDEAPARESLRAYLAATPWIEVVGEAVDGLSAVELAEKHRPGLLFLDVRLPELSGLEVARQIRHPAEIIFTTAYDRFAVAAFEIGALDYLVKPFGQERLAAALARLRARMDDAPLPATAGERARSSLTTEPLGRLFARHGDRIVVVPVESIRRIQAQGDYAEVHAAEGVYLMHVTLSELAARLDPRRFRQVHRSHIVNMDTVEHLRPYDDRRLAITLKDGAVVVASRAASEELRRLAK